MELYDGVSRHFTTIEPPCASSGATARKCHSHGGGRPSEVRGKIWATPRIVGTREVVYALFFLLSNYGIGIGITYHSPSRLLDLRPVDRQEPFGSIFPSTVQLHFRVVYELAHVITRTLSLAKQRQYRFSLDSPARTLPRDGADQVAPLSLSRGSPPPRMRGPREVAASRAKRRATLDSRGLS